jgi:peptidoglycan lytic transglycosylase G
LFAGNRSQPSRERTAEERERAREERERRRGRTAEVAQPVGEQTSSAVESPAVEEPLVVESPLEIEPAPAEHLAVEPAPAEPPSAEALPAAPPPADSEMIDPPTVEVPAVVVQAPVEDGPVSSEPAVAASEPAVVGSEPVVVGSEPVVAGSEPAVANHPIEAEPSPPQPPPQRIAPPSRNAGRRRTRGRAAGLPGPPTRPLGNPGTPAKRLTRARVAALLALAAVVFVIWFLASVFQPFAGPGHGSVIVNIPKGSSAGRIGSILADDGVISSGFFFGVRALLEGKRGDLHSGRYRMQRDESYAAAIATLSQPPPAVIVVRVTIPEGETRAQIAQIAAADSLTGSYLQAAQRSPLLNPVHYGAPSGTPNLEGFLFPATYELRAGAPVGRLVDEQLAAFQREFGPETIRRAHALGVTPYELLTVASMVEREALLERDRPRVAAVIYNRLHQGMALGIDATIRYALNDYTHPLTAAQLQLDSPYNTRTHHGLPPTPISNPGTASIEAAAHPAHVPYLYYVDGADGCGDLVFSTGIAQFERNAAAYNKAVAANGGNVPACKKK